MGIDSKKPVYITPQEAAIMLRANISTIYEMIRKGNIQAFKPISRRILIKYDDFVEFIEAHKVLSDVDRKRSIEDRDE
jgi:excisionase family DNA binding protein